jgi:predicted dehydrogenase
LKDLDLDVRENSASPLRVAVVGAGLIGRRHIALVRASACCELAAVVDPAPEAALLAQSAQVTCYAELARLLEHDRPDGIIVASPNAFHLEHGLACIDAGIPALIEKPIATTVADGMQLATAAERRGVPVLVGHHRRHSPILTAARKTIASGMIGELVGVTGMALFFKPHDYFASAPWRRLPGGGPILINMVHEVDDLRVLCGDIENVRAIASNARRQSAVEDTVAIALRFASGALGSFLLSDVAAAPWSWEQTSGEDEALAPYPEEDCYLLVGTRGALAVPTLRLWTSSGAPSWRQPMNTSSIEIERADPLARQLDHFCQVLRRQAPPLVTAADATETLRVTLAIADAARAER